MQQFEFAAGQNQWIVVYAPNDTGEEINPPEIFEAIARDAAERAARGLRIVSTSTVPVRHAGVAMGRQGSGYETRIAIAVVYAAG